MDRLMSKWAGCGLALALATAAAGCRSTKSDVPSPPSFTGTGPQTPPPQIGFSSAPNPADASAGPLANGTGQYGIPSPNNTPNYGVTNGAFGAPGTAGLASPPTTSLPGAGGMPAPNAAADPTTGIPQTGTGPTGPAAGIGVAPTPATGP